MKVTKTDAAITQPATDAVIFCRPLDVECDLLQESRGKVITVSISISVSYQKRQP